MFTRLKGGDRGGGGASKNVAPAPTKEDILSSIDQFSNENNVRSPKGITAFSLCPI